MKRNKILLTGHSGYVGGIIWDYLKNGYDVAGVSSKSPGGHNLFRCNLRDSRAVRELALQVAPDIIIHAAGNKDISFCESHPDDAYADNGETVANLIDAFPQARHFYISTDYVFDGHRGNYCEGEIPAPANVYGKSKLYGEQVGLARSERFVIVRLCALYNMNATFPRFLYKSFSEKRQVQAYDDVIYSPTYYKDFLGLMSCLLETRDTGVKIIHCGGESISRYEFARNFAEAFRFENSLLQKAQNNNQDNRLFPNLSLSSEESRRIFGFSLTGSQQALAEMRKEFDEETGNLSAIRR
jgi:dTDP-4-dehydrorhamnose reductase